MINNRKLFTMLVVSYLLLASGYVSGLQAQEADVVRVSGTVSDESGSPIPGVAVIIKGTNKGIVTDMNGAFSLNVPDENAILQFRFIGYAVQETVVGMRQIINVAMAELEAPVGIEPAKPVNLTINQRKKAETDNSVAFKMFREVSKQEGDNTFFSPFSLNMALGMLYNGTSDKTRTEMVKVLGIADFSESEINEYYQKISQVLLEIDPITDITIANSIWYRHNFPVKNTFIETGKKYFDTEVQVLDFNNPNAADVINKWCADKTKNRINHIVAGPIPDNMMLYLINALYFKSKWQMEKKFDKEKTKLDDFNKTGNQKIKVQMMEQTSTLPYYADQYLQCIELPYGNQAFSMVAILPSGNMKINQLIEYLPDADWQNIVNSMRQQRVWLKLPRFKIECKLPLNQPVKNLGMNRIFNGDFANISDESLAVSEIRQKTFVEVNEEGTEAAAVTVTAIVAFGTQKRGDPIEPVRFFADRPFLFLIREKSTGVILFIGRIDEPRE